MAEKVWTRIVTDWLEEHPNLHVWATSREWRIDCIHMDLPPPEIQETNFIYIIWYTVSLIMVIAMSGVQFGLKLYALFQNQTSTKREFDLKSQVWLQTQLHNPKFNYHFTRSILKSHNLTAQIQELQDFGQYQYLLNQVAKFAKQWLRKRCDLEQKMVRFVNKSHCWEPIKLQGQPVISKWI